MFSRRVITSFLRPVAIAAGMVLIAACSQTPKATDGIGGGNAHVKPGSTQDFAVNVGNTVQFEEDSSDLTAMAQSILDKQVRWLKSYGSYRVTIEGHADERGTREYNLALGARRAISVRRYLISRGVRSSRLRTTSYGKERPAADCDAESCWRQNRRAVTALGTAGS